MHFWALFTFLLGSLAVTIAQPSEIADAKVVVCSIVRGEEKYIDEWLRYNQYLGFDRVYLYDNSDLASDYLQSLNMVYGDFVNVTHYPGVNRQLAAYKDFLSKHRTENMWAAVIDGDEFINLRNHESIQAFLRDLAPTGGGLSINWKRFSNGGEKKSTSYPLVAKFTHTTRDVSRYTKTISYLPHTETIRQHLSDMLKGHTKVDVSRRPMPNGNYDWHDNAGNGDIAYVAHYHTKSLEEYVAKRHRGLADHDNRGGHVSYTTIVKEFERYNVPYFEIEDTSVRDFYLRRYLGGAYTPVLGSADATNSGVERW